jgi:hypothetical protein
MFVFSRIKINLKYHSLLMQAWGVKKEKDHVAPTGLERVGPSVSITMPPRWGCFFQRQWWIHECQV